MKNIKTTEDIDLKEVKVDNEIYYRISNVDQMRPFFMSIVSDSNHWMFIGSNGGLSAGRKHAEHALFPYYTDDKIIASVEHTGSKSIFIINQKGKKHIWEPFSERFACLYDISRNLYKNVHGNKVLFEEINHDLNLTFRYQWNSTNRYGFARKSCLINNGEDTIDLSLVDGIQNIMPFGVDSELQHKSSNLADAYKRNELKEDSGIGIFALSAIIVDKAEPSEALKANIAWSLGLDQPKHLLSSLQLEKFRKSHSVESETDVKAEKGAYFVQTELSLAAGEKKEWMIMANVNQNISNIAVVAATIKNEKDLSQLINEDIEAGTKNLIALNAAADGLQMTADQSRNTRHFSNTLFNIMRGGIFDNNYQIEKKDFLDYLSKVNHDVFQSLKQDLNKLDTAFSLSDLKSLAFESNNTDFRRLSLEYMPLKFSRRHGDPSRPWNQFSINTHSEVDGSKILDYEGNWRDIFQNWEALAHSYPEFIESMICKFLNASTFDGYNPYRVTKNGIDWETNDPDDPWSYIGYWGDHQIIYLLKFLEFTENHHPGKLESYFGQDLFVYANVPYKIKEYDDLLKNPKDTIEFDSELHDQIHEEWSDLGADSALLKDRQGSIYQVNFIEKILATVLAKMSNFIPEAGIWMSTQRPEWNDANNALVGNGVSMVTLYYLRRFLKFFEKTFDSTDVQEVLLSDELLQFFNATTSTLNHHEHLLSDKLSDNNRKQILDGLGKAGSAYRTQVYRNTFSGDKKKVSITELKRFVEVSLHYLEHSIQANKRHDNLYHAYNLMTVHDDEVTIAHLSEMLEGQVAVLSSGYLSSSETLEVLDALKSSKLFREDQYSYMLYPNKDLPGFTEKNNIAASAVEKSELLTEMLAGHHTALVCKDIDGAYHFNDSFKNAVDVQNALDSLSTTKYAALAKADSELILQIFEEVFNHKAFTGRSGTFFGYEGLGSIYWHMVSKLQLAVQECCLAAIKEKADKGLIGKLLEHYYEINQSIGIHKSPELYGAFPTDPYSHTPAGKGAQQPGMTGQVKEDVICRFGELGVFVAQGKLLFNPCLLRHEEFLKESKSFQYIDLSSQPQEIELKVDSLSFTYCQVPIIYQISDENNLIMERSDGKRNTSKDWSLSTEESQLVFHRSGDIAKITVNIKRSMIR